MRLSDCFMRLLTLAFACAAVLGLVAACGGNDSTPQSKTATSATTLPADRRPPPGLIAAVSPAKDSSAFPANHVYLVGSDGDGLTRLLRRGRLDSFLFEWSPDGKTVAVGTENVDAIWLVRVGETKGDLLIRSGSVSDPSWSPDGRHLAV